MKRKMREEANLEEASLLAKRRLKSTWRHSITKDQVEALSLPLILPYSL